MRLLSLDENGSFSLTEFFGVDIPPYAILSHTWGPDNEEVTFKDLLEGSHGTKTGVRKLHFCVQEASKDNLQYFWVDTCSIDKASSAELSEAINSMFRWYRNSNRCYVYLSDVSTAVSQSPQPAWETMLRKSRWFTRGWTLQELVAPASVEFFSIEGKMIGNKVSLERQIHEITGIAVEVLRDAALLPQFSIDERMSWAAGRQTKREEDSAYSLLGIFDIHIPLIYGEGKHKAMIRLRKEIQESLKDETLIQRTKRLWMEEDTTNHEQPPLNRHAKASNRLLPWGINKSNDPGRSTQVNDMKYTETGKGALATTL
jgi:hypothetical protein